MLCTFCGTENSPENKFCGMCGVKLERRKIERRVRHGAASLKCASCGHICEPGTTFCGMCGARIERRFSDRRGPQDRATAIANFTLPSPEVSGKEEVINKPDVAEKKETEAKPVVETAPEPAAEAKPPAAPLPEEVLPRPPAAIFRSAPAERPAPVERSTIAGPSFLGLNDAPANPGEYLLDDEKPSGSKVRIVVFVGILAVVLGLIFLQWRSGWRPGQKSPEPAKAAPAASSPEEQKAKQDTAPTPEATSTPAAAEPAPSPAATATSDKVQDPDAAKASPTATPEAPADTAKTEDMNARAAKNAAKKEKAREEPASIKPSATLIKAQDYLQGRNGVQQNCEQGLTYLRAAVQRSEPAAAMQMGELYASGRCVPQDRVTAYRWMNSAREKAPGNPAIQATVDQLWGRMTPQERQEAGH